MRLRLAFWLFALLGRYIEKHAVLNRSTEAVIAIQAPGWLMVDGNWMPDRQASVQQ